MKCVFGCNNYIMCALEIGEKMNQVIYNVHSIIYVKISFLNFPKMTHSINKINTSLWLCIISLWKSEHMGGWPNIWADLP
jgi:sensor histidine kinase YesM